MFFTAVEIVILTSRSGSLSHVLRRREQVFGMVTGRFMNGEAPLALVPEWMLIKFNNRRKNRGKRRKGGM